MHQHLPLFTPVARCRSLNRRGVTLIELLVVMSLVTLMFTVLISLVSHSSALVAQGTQVIALNQKARFAIDKIAPYVMTAVADATSPAIVAPNRKVDAPSAADLLSYDRIQFSTTEDFLDPNYDASAAYNATSRPIYFYEIYFDNTTNPIPYKMENGTDINLGRIMIVKHQTSSFNAPATAYKAQALAYNVQFFHAHRLDGNTIEVIIHTIGKRKGPAGNQIDVFEQAQGILDVPSPSYNY